LFPGATQRGERHEDLSLPRHRVLNSRPLQGAHPLHDLPLFRPHRIHQLHGLDQGRCRSCYQGTLTEGEGSVQLTSLYSLV
jgi:hypothetical protein